MYASKPTAEEMEDRIALAITYRLAMGEGLIMTGGPAYGYDELCRPDGRACLVGMASDDSLGNWPNDLGVGHLINMSDEGNFNYVLDQLEDLAGMTLPEESDAH